MKVEKVEFGRTKTVNFQASRATCTVVMEEGDSVEAASKYAKSVVALMLGERPTDAEVQAAEEVLERKRLLDAAGVGRRG